MLKNIIEFFQIRKALKRALKDFDETVVLEIIENEEDGWSNGCEILNGIDISKVKKVMRFV